MQAKVAELLLAHQHVTTLVIVLLWRRVGCGDSSKGRSELLWGKGGVSGEGSP